MNKFSFLAIFPTTFLLVFLFTGFTTSYENEGVRFNCIYERTVIEGEYIAHLQVKNAKDISEFAKLEVMFPKGVAFIAMEHGNELVMNEFKEGKLKFVWMHFANDANYILKYKISTPKELSKLTFEHKFWAVKAEEKLSFSWVQNAEILN